ncbi:MAG: hypothetical protein V1787_00410 [Candidatus Micrarchaeota archaeon]
MPRKKKATGGGPGGGMDAPAGIEGEDLDLLKTLRARRKAELEELAKQEDD